jgi:hypothetical protein
VVTFKYLGTRVTNQNSTQEEIKSTLNMGNAFYHSVQNFLSSRLLSKNVKILKQKTIILLVVLFGCETLSLLLIGEHIQKVFENRGLRRIFGLKRDEAILVLTTGRPVSDANHYGGYTN